MLLIYSKPYMGFLRSPCIKVIPPPNNNNNQGH